MLEYLPWSDNELSATLEFYKKKLLTILDIELGGACNLSCIYCDTPDRKTKSKISFNYLEYLFSQKNIRWLFICGLGEPTVGPNLPELLEILSLCKKNSIKCSMFTNIVNLDENIKKYISEGVLHILFKLDTFKLSRVTELFKTNHPQTVLDNIEEVKSLVNFNNNKTNIAASIVPTKINYEELPSLIDFCFDNNIFPMIGDLEDSGRSLDNYNELKVSAEDLYKIRKYIRTLTGCDYKVPICPSVIGGIHINHDNNLIVDHYTGLSCHWFWLKEPKTKNLGNTNNSMNYSELCSRIIDYRIDKLSLVKQHVAKMTELPFGGCGGDIKYMLTRYLDASKNMIP